jgi:hypothetical protein
MSDQSEYVLTKTRMIEGVWEGVVTVRDRVLPPPEISVTVQETGVPGVTLSPLPDDEGWLLKIPVPPKAIADGVQTFLIAETRSDALLGSFTIVAGEALAEDIRAEMDLLRAEIDMLKRAFRRHCLETA